ncbi:MAG: phosphate acyltransferase PlsX [Gemmataceae bacterium]
MRLALDAMGGDHGPGPNVAGAVAAVNSAPDLEISLVGDPAVIEPLLAQAGSSNRISIVPAMQNIGMDEKPAEALRKKPDSTIAVGWKLAATKQVDGFISAGNTGAVVAGGLFTRRFLKGVRRPGIATLMPTAAGRCVIMDVGANVFPKPSHLLQYGIMGSLYAQHLLNIPNPKIGLINVGEEEGKGHDLVQKTYDLFRAGPVKDSFAGNIEGRDIHAGKVDVVVCDGFVGNVILKLSQGVFQFVVSMIKNDIISKLNAEKMIAAEALKGLVGKYHYSAVGGAPLLGIDGVCIICHGSSDERAIANALSVAAQNVRVKLNEKIVEALAAMPDVGEE